MFLRFFPLDPQVPLDFIDLLNLGSFTNLHKLSLLKVSPIQKLIFDFERWPAYGLFN